MIQLYVTRTQYLCHSYHAFYYIHYVNQQMHLTKYNKLQFMISINSYMLWHWNANFREPTKTKEHRSNMQSR